MAEPEKRRVVQIATAGVANHIGTQCDAFLFALCDDGTIWRCDNSYWRWTEMPPVEEFFHQIG